MYKPIVSNNGNLEELQSGDTLYGVASGDVVLDIKDENTLKKEGVKNLVFSGGVFLEDAGGNELKISSSNGGATSFSPRMPVISGLRKAEITSSNSENYSISTGNNDKIKLNIDKCGSVEVTLTSGSRTASQICNDINLALNSSTNYHDSYTYAIDDNSKVKLRSLRYMKNPEIIIESISNDAYTTLGFSTGTTDSWKQNELKVHPYDLLLPDGTIQKETTQKTLDITNDDDLEQQSLTASSSQKIFNFSDMKLETYEKQYTTITYPHIHLRFNNSFFDLSDNNHIVQTITGVTFNSSVKKLGSHSADFSGSSAYLDFGNIADLERDEEFSFEGWVRFDSVGSAQGIISKRLGGATYQGYYFGIDGNNKLTFILANNLGAGQYLHITTTSTYSANTWYHFVLTYDGSGNASGAKIYVNNTLQNVTINKNTLSGDISNSANLIIGNNQGLSIGIDGKLDSIIIHGSELATLEINDRYRNGQYSCHGLDADKCLLNLTCYNSVDDSSYREKSTTGNNISYSGTAPDRYAVFNGTSSKIDLGNDSSLLFEKDEEFSFSYWFNPSDASSSYRTIFSSVDSSGDKGIIVRHQNGKIEVHLVNTSGSNSIVISTTNNVLGTSSFKHVFITYDGSGSANGAKIYVNNVEITDITTTYDNLSATIVNSSNNINIGYDNNSNYLYGNLRDLLIFSEKLSTSQKEEIYNSGVKKSYDYISYNPAELVLHLNNTNNDSSQNNYVGTSTNITYSSSVKKLGSHSASFNGISSKIDYNDVCSFEKDKPFSFEFWVYVDSSGSGARPILSKINSSGSNEGYEIEINSSGGLQFTIVDISTSMYVYTSPVSTDTLIHAVVSYDGSSNRSGMKIYINSVAQSLTTGGSSSLSNTIVSTAPLIVGSQSTNWFDGYIDELIIYSEEISQADVNNRYNSGNGEEYNFGSEEIPVFKVLVNSVQQELNNDYVLNSETQIEFYSGLSSSDIVEAIIKIEGNRWYYLYITDISLFSTRKVFASNQRPNWFGEHQKSNFNGRYIGSFKTDGLTEIRPFIKFGDEVLQEEEIIYSGTITTDGSNLNLNDYLPPTTNLAKLSALSSTVNSRPYVWSRFDSNFLCSLAGKCKGINYRDLIYLTDEERNIFLQREDQNNTINVYSHGYMENVLEPIGA